jgi:DNA-binding MarR family transcriptional regulator
MYNEQHMKTGDSQRAARELLHVALLVMKGVAAEMRRSELPLAPAQLGTLMRVANGTCTVSELARHQLVSLPTMSRTVDMLVRRELLERWIDEDDRRQTLVRLTPQGSRVVADVKRRSEQHVARILEDLTGDEHDRVLQALDVLDRVLNTPAGALGKSVSRSSNGARRHVSS